MVELAALDTLWFQVGGTVCNLACTHCFVSCSPTNHTHEFMTLAAIQPYLDEAAGLGVKEYYFTGGEPFLNPEMEAILERTLEYGRREGIPVVTVWGLQFSVLLGGTVIQERIFNFPGLGQAVIESILARDYPVILTVNFLSAVLVLIGTFVSDLLYLVVDPRIRL